MSGVGQINVESAEELDMLAAAAAATGRTARVALRVNPDVDAGTHAKITTGRADNKFGIAFANAPALYARAASLPGVEPGGLAVHIGSQVLGMAPFRAAYTRIAELVQALRGQGQAVSTVDCGGGLGIPYRDEIAPAPEAFAGAIRATLGGLGVRVAVEPGRWLAGPAGLLLASVVLTKETGGRRFVVLDAAMNDLLRPAMYEAWHGIVPVSAADAVAPAAAADVVGPVCETGDTFARLRALPPLAANARVAILDAGAYGAVMSCTYNARPLAAQVLVDGTRWAVIRQRQSVESLWAGERVPDLAGVNEPALPAQARARARGAAVRAGLARALAVARRARPLRRVRPARRPCPAAALAPDCPSARRARVCGRAGVAGPAPGAGAGHRGRRPAAGARHRAAAPAACRPR